LRLSDFDLSFATAGGMAIETRVSYLGRGTLRAGPVRVQPITAPEPKTHFRDWPLAFLWVGGTLLVGWLFVQVMTLSRRQVPSTEGDSAHSAGPREPPSH
jgi:hypothetical protein